MGVWSDATDDWDPDYDVELYTEGGIGYAGVYHEPGLNGWTGPKLFLFSDWRSPIGPNESKTWEDVFVWADPIYAGDDMAFSVEADLDYPPPSNRDYELKLVTVPEDVTGAPPVGTVWKLPMHEVFTLLLPAHKSEDGTTGYEFEFTITAELDPCSDFLLGDSDCNHVVDFDDIAVFIAALSGEQAWMDALGGAPPCDYYCANDVNGDGVVTFDDIAAFVRCLSGECE